MLLAVVICCSAFAASAGGGKRLKLQSDAAIVIDQATGRTVYEDGSTLKRYPASTTKIMTCLLALEDGHMDRVVTVSHNAANVESTQLHEGDQMTMKEMLYEMMLVSDNGAAIAIAESIAGSVPAIRSLRADALHQGVSAARQSSLLSYCMHRTKTAVLPIRGSCSITDSTI